MKNNDSPPAAGSSRAHDLDKCPVGPPELLLGAQLHRIGPFVVSPVDLESPILPVNFALDFWLGRFGPVPDLLSGSYAQNAMQMKLRLIYAF